MRSAEVTWDNVQRVRHVGDHEGGKTQQCLVQNVLTYKLALKYLVRAGSTNLNAKHTPESLGPKHITSALHNCIYRLYASQHFLILAKEALLNANAPDPVQCCMMHPCLHGSAGLTASTAPAE